MACVYFVIFRLIIFDNIYMYIDKLIRLKVCLSCFILQYLDSVLAKNSKPCMFINLTEQR